MRIIVTVSILFSLSACTAKKQENPVDRYLAQYVFHDMHFDASVFNEKDRTLLRKLVEAAEYVDKIYWKQTSLYSMKVRDSLAGLTGDVNAGKLLTLVRRNAGIWEQLNSHTPFIGHRIYYPGGELYPQGMTATDFDDFLKDKPKDVRDAFMSPYTAISKDDSVLYKAVPYHELYREEITAIEKLLNECAELTDNESFAKFLRLKAQALKTDRYFEADAAWIDMEDSKFDMVFGPFETYSDGIKGVKAKYEANIEVIDQEESKKLDIYTKYLKEFESNLPVDEVYKSKVDGLTAKFVIVRDIIRAGESAIGYQAVATNLPNDPEVHAKKGTKKTFWKNMFEARFNRIIRPVSEQLIDQGLLQHLSDQGFFQFVLMHEICHAVGPRTVKTGANKGMAVNASIGPLYNALEEAKADIAGLHSLFWLMDQGIVEKSREREFVVSYLGSLFRSIRFGTTQAHGKAALVSLNYFQQNGGVSFNEKTGRWSIEFDNFRANVSRLTSELVVLEGDGESSKVQAFFDQWAKMTPELNRSLEAVRNLPTDVIPRYTIKWD